MQTSTVNRVSRQWQTAINQCWSEDGPFSEDAPSALTLLIPSPHVDVALLPDHSGVLSSACYHPWEYVSLEEARDK